MNSQENKKSDHAELTNNQRKQSKKLSLEATHNEIAMVNKIENSTNTADQMEYFDIFAYTFKMMELNKENIG